jgi:hypothetical protein
MKEFMERYKDQLFQSQIDALQKKIRKLEKVVFDKQIWEMIFAICMHSLHRRMARKSRSRKVHK